MATPVSSIPNLGPAFQRDSARAGIHSAEELRALVPRFGVFDSFDFF